MFKDRVRDAVISGGENISSLEVEDVPCIELKEGEKATEQEIIEFCRERMARFKVPKKVVFGPLPKTSTGKIQKFLLRERAKAA